MPREREIPAPRACSPIRIVHVIDEPMSRNFELMQAEQLEREGLAHLPEPKTALFPGPEIARTPQQPTQEFDRTAQEECLKLVQRIFLSQPANVCRAIVFAGVDR